MLPRTKIIVAAIIIFLGLIVLDQVRRHSHSDEEDESLTAHHQEEAVKKSKETEWKEFNSSIGMFKVMLPALPQHASEVVPLPAGEGFIKYDMYLSQAKEGATFMISLIQYPEKFKASDPFELLEDVMKEMMSANGNNKLKESQQGQFKQFPSLDFSIKNNNVSIRSKTFLVGKTLFVLTAIDRDTMRLEEEFKKFTDSFEFGESILNEVKSGELKSAEPKVPADASEKPVESEVTK
jgi:hypothetical protein